MFSENKKIMYIMFLFGFFFILSCAAKEKRVDLAEAVGKQDIDTIVSVIKNPKKPWYRGEASRYLGKIRGHTAVEPLIGLLKDENRDVRWGAAEALGEIGDTRAVKPLLAALKYKAKRWPRPALEAIHKIGTSAVEILLEELKNVDPEIRKYTVDALSLIGDRRTVDPIIETLQSETDQEAKISMVNRVIKWKSPKLSDDPRMLDVYISLLDSNRVKTREQAARLILDLKDSKAVKRQLDALIILLNSDNSEWRLQAAKSLSKYAGPKTKKIKEQVEKILKEETFIEEAVLYDQFGRPTNIAIRNSDGEVVAYKKYEFHKFNDMLIRKEVITDRSNHKVIVEIDYDNYGRKLNPRLICLDREGNIVRKNNRAVLVNYFNPQQKQNTRHYYRLGTKIKSTSFTKIYPCKNCSEQTGIEACQYVWGVNKRIEKIFIFK